MASIIVVPKDVYLIPGICDYVMLLGNGGIKVSDEIKVVNQLTMR